MQLSGSSPVTPLAASCAGSLQVFYMVAFIYRKVVLIQHKYATMYTYLRNSISYDSDLSTKRFQRVLTIHDKKKIKEIIIVK